MTVPKYYKSSEGKYLEYYMCIDQDSTEIIEHNKYTDRLSLRNIPIDAPLPGGNPGRIELQEYAQVVTDYAYEENRNWFVKFLRTSWLSLWYFVKNPPVYISFLTPTAKVVLGIGAFIGLVSTSLSMWCFGVCSAMTCLTSPGSDSSNMTMIYWTVGIVISWLAMIIGVFI